MGAIYFRDENGEVVQAGADHPLPVTSAGTSAQMLAAEAEPLPEGEATTTVEEE